MAGRTKAHLRGRISDEPPVRMKKLEEVTIER
jgi:hypothetical protein